MPATSDETPAAAGDELAAVLERHAPALLSLPGVVGVAEGEADGRPCVVVFVAEAAPGTAAVIPAELEGWPVVLRESGGFRALSD